MLKNILLINFSLLFIILFNGCNTTIESKKTNFIDSTFLANKINVDTTKSLMIAYTPQNDCKSCMYRANDVFNELFYKKIGIPNSNIIFVTDDIRDIEVDYLFKNTYNFNVKKYNLIKSDNLIKELLSKYNISYGGTCIFVLDKDKELLYYNLPKKIYNLDSLVSIINNN